MCVLVILTILLYLLREPGISYSIGLCYLESVILYNILYWDAPIKTSFLILQQKKQKYAHSGYGINKGLLVEFDQYNSIYFNLTS